MLLQRILKLPFLVLLMGMGAAAMYAPSFYALTLRDYETSRIFFYSGTFFLVLTSMIALATANGRPVHDPRQHLAALAGSFVLLPLMLAVPVVEVVRDTSFLNAWFEMVSCFTTTGATVFDPPDRLPAAVHFWRALVGWLGGLLIWISAIAILSPLNLGGFEVTAGARPPQKAESLRMGELTSPSDRLKRQAATFFPIYAGLTIALWLGLLITGLPPLEAVSFAMSTLSTSGILPIALTAPEAAVPFGAEVLVFVFFVFAFSRNAFQPEALPRKWQKLRDDPELRLALLLILALPAALFLRHWIGAFEVSRTDEVGTGLSALWGSLFTIASFLSTTGFVSQSWGDAQSWSGLSTPGLILTGLAALGGGVATTAGGVKLMRVVVLYRHGRIEMDKLAHPSRVAGSDRRVGRKGTYVAWIFFMLIVLMTAAVMLALSMTGLSFEQNATLAVAALSTTGPLAQIAMDPPLAYSELGQGAKLILATAMVLGRMEVLALVALLNPDFWRR